MDSQLKFLDFYFCVFAGSTGKNDWGKGRKSETHRSAGGIRGCAETEREVSIASNCRGFKKNSFSSCSFYFLNLITVSNENANYDTPARLTGQSTEPENIPEKWKKFFFHAPKKESKVSFNPINFEEIFPTSFSRSETTNPIDNLDKNCSKFVFDYEGISVLPSRLDRWSN